MGAIVLSELAASTPCASRLESVFMRCFSHSNGTRLAGGFDEPLYKPAGCAGQMHLLRYREDFFASALHEVAHWCIAGPARRLQTDFGYWYVPDGRNPAQQSAFEAVEYKPQALEWFFSKACAQPFRISIDNLHGPMGDNGSDSGFERRVIEQALKWQHEGLPVDGGVFFRALCREFSVSDELNGLRFSRSELC